MKIVFWPTAWEDYLHWQTHDPRTLDKINALIAECRRHPFKGDAQSLDVAQCRYHY